VVGIAEDDLVIAPFLYSDGTCPHCQVGVTFSCVAGGSFGDGGPGWPRPNDHMYQRGPQPRRRRQELQLASARIDGNLHSYVTMWVVRADDELYVRSAHGPTNPWCRRANRPKP
jgi:hypothetical protein